MKIINISEDEHDRVTLTLEGISDGEFHKIRSVKGKEVNLFFNVTEEGDNTGGDLVESQPFPVKTNKWPKDLLELLRCISVKYKRKNSNLYSHGGRQWSTGFLWPRRGDRSTGKAQWKVMNDGKLEVDFFLVFRLLDEYAIDVLHDHQVLETKRFNDELVSEAINTDPSDFSRWGDNHNCGAYVKLLIQGHTINLFMIAKRQLRSDTCAQFAQSSNCDFGD